jgi:hypothetical protein
VILLSLVLVVVSATTLAFGVFTTGDALVWTSLGAGLGAVALVAGSVVRRRSAAVAPGAGPDLAGAVAVGPPATGSDPVFPPAPSRPVGSTGSPPPPTQSDPGPTRPDPGSSPRRDASPWAPVPPGGSGTRGWSGHVPSVTPPPDRPAAPPEPPPAAPEPPPALPEAAVAATEDGVETVPVRDALRVAQLADEVLVEDGRPRYHLAGCAALDGTPTVPLPVSAARRGGFTPCAVCTPDRVLLRRLTDRRTDPR